MIVLLTANLKGDEGVESPDTFVSEIRDWRILFCEVVQYEDFRQKGISGHLDA